MRDPFFFRGKLHIITVKVLKVVFSASGGGYCHILKLHGNGFQVELSRNALLRAVAVCNSAPVAAIVHFVSAAGLVDVVQDPGFKDLVDSIL